jgi:cyclic dehypoxanthinyl futalosine synthase
LQFGADDVGSILIEENVVYAAGVRNRTNEEELRRIISDAGYLPAQRDTLYRSYILKPAAEQDPIKTDASLMAQAAKHN